MTEKRVLPVRAKRGKNMNASFFIKESVISNDEAIQNIQQEVNEASQKTELSSTMAKRLHCESQSCNKYQKSVSQNKIHYPFARGYHYFFDLSTFPRAEGSISYAEDKSNIFNFTYSQENLVLKQHTLGQIINRHLIGIPIQNLSDSQPPKNKYECLTYLYENEDKRSELDRKIIELRFLLKNLEGLLSSNKINDYSCFRKETSLAPVIDAGLTLEDKKKIIVKKIKALEQKKSKMFKALEIEDRRYYYHSLNEKLFAEIDKREKKFTWNKVMQQLFQRDKIREQLRQQMQVECGNEVAALINRLFAYNSMEQCCISPSSLETFKKSLEGSFFEKDECDNYRIAVPDEIYLFKNAKILEMTERLLADYLAGESEICFYIGKVMWNRIFKRKFEINKEAKNYTQQQFDKVMSATISKLKKHFSCKQGIQARTPIRSQRQSRLQQNRQKNAAKLLQQEQSRSKHYLDFTQVFKMKSTALNDSSPLFCRKEEVEISLKQYYCISLFYQAYICLESISDHLLKNQMLIDLIGIFLFTKYHPVVVSIIESVNFGSLYAILTTIGQFMTRASVECDYSLKWVFHSDLNVGYLHKIHTRNEGKCENQAWRVLPHSPSLKLS